MTQERERSLEGHTEAHRRSRRLSPYGLVGKYGKYGNMGYVGRPDKVAPDRMAPDRMAGRVGGGDSPQAPEKIGERSRIRSTSISTEFFLRRADSIVQKPAGAREDLKTLSFIDIIRNISGIFYKNV